jgi:hypothetical protein
VLLLEGCRYYIGASDDIEVSFQQHIHGKGPEWTRIHRPILIENTYDNANPFEKDNVTKTYMFKYGMRFVRGGSYSDVKLSQMQIETLIYEIWTSKGLCINCGRDNHQTKDCHETQDVPSTFDSKDILNEVLESNIDGHAVINSFIRTPFGCSYK